MQANVVQADLDAALDGEAETFDGEAGAFDIEADGADAWGPGFGAEDAAQEEAAQSDAGDDPERPMHPRELIDVNTAGPIALASLPTLTPRAAQAIVAARPYENMQDFWARASLSAHQSAVLASWLYAGHPSIPWNTRIDNRAWWRNEQSPATALGVTTEARAWQLGIMAATPARGLAPPPGLAARAVMPYDGYILRDTGAHRWVLGYYDIGFGTQLTLDTSAGVAADGIQRRKLAMGQRRAPRLLGGAYTWQQHPARAQGWSATALVATHAVLRPIAAAHLAHSWDARNRLGGVGYIGSGVGTRRAVPSARAAGAQNFELPPESDVAVQAVGLMWQAGWGRCDGRLQTAVTGRQAVAYGVDAACDATATWRLGMAWHDLPQSFDNPMARITRGRTARNQRAATAWMQLDFDRVQATSRTAAIWPHDDCAAATSTSQERWACPARAWSVQHAARLKLPQQHSVFGRTRSWRPKARRADWMHAVTFGWGHTARRGLQSAASTTWQRHPASAHPNRMRTTLRLSWRSPTWAVGGAATASLDAWRWQGGLWAAYEVSQTATVSLRLQATQTHMTAEVRPAATFTASWRF